MRIWNIFNEMNSMQREFDRLFGASFSSGFNRQVLMPEVANNSFRFKVREDDDNFYLEAILPGIDVKNLDMSITGNHLSLAIDRATADANKDENEQKTNWYRRERNAGNFKRTLRLSSDVDSAGAEAKYRNGILKVTLPKVEAAKPKRIEVKAA